MYAQIVYVCMDVLFLNSLFYACHVSLLNVKAPAAF